MQGTHAGFSLLVCAAIQQNRSQRHVAAPRAPVQRRREDLHPVDVSQASINTRTLMAAQRLLARLPRALFFALTSTPRSSSSVATPSWPPSAAKCSGVQSSPLRASCFAPAASSSVAADGHPWLAARCSGVEPHCGAERRQMR